MNPDTNQFEAMDFPEDSAEHLKKLADLAAAWERHSIKEAQIFKVGEVVELKGAEYRVKSIHTKSIVLTPNYGQDS